MTNQNEDFSYTVLLQFILDHSELNVNRKNLNIHFW